MVSRNKNKNNYKNYKKPPITEAIIEVRFEDSISDSQLDTLSKQQKSKFTIEKLEKFEIRVSPDAAEHQGKKLFAFKLIENADTANVIQLRHNAISVCRMAPYKSWDILFSNFKKFYDVYTKKKHKNISRIGVRFINRIDIPIHGKDEIKIADYIKVYAYVPETKFPALADSRTQTTSLIDENRILIINSYRHEEVLMEHRSFVLDLDIARIKNLPATSNKLFEELGELRHQKNLFFETLTTKKCKDLFK